MSQTDIGPPVEDIQLTDVMQALSDPVRLRIVQSLGANPDGVYCRTFAQHLAKATRSYHLKILRDAGLTQTRRDGTFKIIRLRRAEFDDRFPGLIDGIMADAPPAEPVVVPKGAPALAA